MDGQTVPVTSYAQARAKVSDGKSVRVTVPENTTIEAQKFYLLEGFFGVALESVITGAGITAEIELSLEQAEYESDQITIAEAFAKGTPIFWNNSTGTFTEIATGNRFVGVVASAKDANNVIWLELSPQANGMVQGAAVASVASADAGGAYTAAEQALINELKAQLNALLVSLRAGEIIA